MSGRLMTLHAISPAALKWFPTVLLKSVRFGSSSCLSWWDEVESTIDRLTLRIALGAPVRSAPYLHAGKWLLVFRIVVGPSQCLFQLLSKLFVFHIVVGPSQCLCQLLPQLSDWRPIVLQLIPLVCMPTICHHCPSDNLLPSIVSNCNCAVHSEKLPKEHIYWRSEQTLF